ncbi:hypothetical protein JCM19233_2078 [Vibrio astriarenae]|nr:hypothetical protein JCM19233_2078 [Vibrio sp. C7]
MNQVISVGALESFLIAIIVLFLGHFINSKLPVLKSSTFPNRLLGD